MIASIGKSWRVDISENVYVDIAIHKVSFFRTRINMELWEKGNPIALNFREEYYFSLLHWFLSTAMIQSIMKRKLNNQFASICKSRVLLCK